MRKFFIALLYIHICFEFIICVIILKGGDYMTPTQAKVFDATKEILLALISKDAVNHNSFDDTKTNVEAAAKAFDLIYNEILKTVK